MAKSENTRPCCICEKRLHPAMPNPPSNIDDWKTLQPMDGGEIQLIFGYGSAKFDHMLEGTKFRGIICDDCAEKVIKNLYIEIGTRHPIRGNLSQYNSELPT